MFPGEFQVKRVRAKVNSVAPTELAPRTDGNFFECLGIGPKPEEALADQMREIHFAGYIVRIGQWQTIVIILELARLT